MNRLVSTFRWDVVIQFRQGFYFVSGFTILIMTALLMQLPSNTRFDLLMPAFVFFSVMITTFYFVGALVLLEKSEGTLAGLAVSPLRESEYLISKVASLTLLAMLENVLVILLVYGLGFSLAWLMVGGIALCTVYTLLGFVAITRYDSINEYLLPSVLIVTLLIIPAVNQLELIESPIFYLHPLQPMLSLMHAAFVHLPSWEIVYGLVGSIFWIGLTFYWARRVFPGLVIRMVG